MKNAALFFETIKEYEELQNMTIRGIESHLENDQAEPEAIASALRQLDRRLQNIIEEYAKENDEE